MGDFAFKKYVFLEEYQRNWIFFDKETKIDDQDSINIKPLTKDYSTFLWCKYVSKRSRHRMLMDSKGEVVFSRSTILLIFSNMTYCCQI